MFREEQWTKELGFVKEKYPIVTPDIGTVNAAM